jgi:hypothetical protein
MVHVGIENVGYCGSDLFYGAGDYNVGDTVTVGCNDDYFVWWEQGDSVINDRSITFVATGDTTFYAYCHEVGIDDVEGYAVRVAVVGRSVSVDVPEGTAIAVYDVQGRLVANRRSFTVPAAGVYMIQIDGKAASRIIIP